MVLMSDLVSVQEWVLELVLVSARVLDLMLGQMWARVLDLE